MRKTFILFYTLLIPAIANGSPKKEMCVYRTGTGTIKQTNSREDVPAQYQDNANCFSPSNNRYLAPPQEVEIQGTARREDISSPLGRIKMRWPRKVEVLFGRTPMRAMEDAARTVARALSKSSFPSALQKLNLDWQVVFLDDEMPETQIPSYLIQNCHPGWMTPPANIYIVGQRVAGGCGGNRASKGVADSVLTGVLIHEMGHVVEHYLLRNSFDGDRMRAEGFATWFEEYASDYSSYVNRRDIVRNHKVQAKAAMRNSPNNFAFSGTSEDYSRAAMYFAAIADKRGISSLMEVYKTMTATGASFFPAIEKTLGWNRERLEQEAKRLAEEK